MQIKEHFHRGAEILLRYPAESEIYQEVKDIVKKCPIPYYKNKSKNQKSICIIQQVMNTYFELMFTKHLAKKWQAEPHASTQSKEDTLKADFRKTFSFDNAIQKDSSKITAQIEVEFGNAASYYRDYFKFQLSYSEFLINIGILICPCSNMSKLIDSGLGNFEKIIRELPSARQTMTVPTYIIGLSYTNDNLWHLDKDKDNINKYGNDYLHILKKSIRAKYENSDMKKNYLKHHKDIVESYINKNLH